MKWIKLDEEAILPQRATEHSAGYDVYANETVRIMPGEVKIISTGISFEGLNSDEFIQIQLRSSISIKRPFLQPNGVGIIDADYAGNPIGLILYNRSKDVPAVVDKGEKIAQCIIMKYLTVDNEKKVTTKRKGGYGSTGN